MYGTDWRYAKTRLQGSVVAWNKELVLIKDVHEGIASFNIVSRPKKDKGEANLADLDVKPIKLGYVNYRGKATYLCRAPVRRDWKQGIRQATMRSLYGHYAEYLPYSVINKTHLNDFPTMARCLSCIMDGGESLAWSRDWAVDSNRNLLYRAGMVVGKFVDGVPTLNPEYIHLKESLESSYEKG